MAYKNIQQYAFMALLLAVMLTGCGSSAPDVPAATDQPPDICIYASDAVDALAKSHEILAYGRRI